MHLSSRLPKKNYESTLLVGEGKVKQSSEERKGTFKKALAQKDGVSKFHQNVQIMKDDSQVLSTEKSKAELIKVPKSPKKTVQTSPEDTLNAPLKKKPSKNLGEISKKGV